MFLDDTAISDDLNGTGTPSNFDSFPGVTVGNAVTATLKADQAVVGDLSLHSDIKGLRKNR